MLRPFGPCWSCWLSSLTIKILAAPLIKSCLLGWEYIKLSLSWHQQRTSSWTESASRQWTQLDKRPGRPWHLLANSITRLVRSAVQNETHRRDRLRSLTDVRSLVHRGSQGRRPMIDGTFYADEQPWQLAPSFMNIDVDCWNWGTRSGSVFAYCVRACDSNRLSVIFDVAVTVAATRLACNSHLLRKTWEKMRCKMHVICKDVCHASS